MTNKKNRKWLYILVLTTALLLALTSIALAAVWTDQQDYVPGSVVTINGDNSNLVAPDVYQYGETVQVYVVGPNGYTASCQGVADANGAWSCQVTLWGDESAVGSYTYTATGLTSGVVDNGTFTDAASVKFISSPFTIEKGTCSPAIKIQTPGTGSTGTLVTLTTNSIGGTFYSDSLCATAITSITTTGSSDTDAPDFYYKDTVTGNPTITISISQPNTDSKAQTETITAPSCTAPAVTINPSGQTITYGTDASFTVAGTNYTTVQWQVSTNEGVSWNDISGATSLSLTVTKPSVSMNGYKYHAVLTGGCTPVATSTAATLTVNKAPVTMTAGSYSGKYDGSSHSPASCAVTGTYTGVLTCTNNPSSVGPNVSSGAVIPVISVNGEDANNFSVTSVNGSYAITAAPVTMTAGSYSGSYDGKSHSPTTCVVTADSPNTYKGTLTCTNNPSSVGPDVSSGTVSPEIDLNSEDANNFSVTPVNGSYAITAAPVTMTAGSYSGTYDGNSHSITACVVTADSPNTYKGTLTCTNDPASVKDAGSGTVTPVLVLNGETATNFEVSSVDGSWKIAPAPVTITAGSYSGTYDGSTHDPSDCEVSGTYTGALTCTNDPVSVGPDAGTGAVAPELVLNGETEANFVVTPKNGSWTIEKANPTCTVTGYTVYFDNSSHTATGSCIGVLLEPLDGLDLSGTTHKLVGNYSDTWTFTDVTGNYNNTSGTVTDSIMAWTLTGFYQPVDMNGVYNVVKNGSTVPLKFEIFAGPTELTDIADVASLTYAQTSCNLITTTDDIETIATGNTVLRYDTVAGQFVYNWKTPNTAGKCYRVTMTTLDGSSLVAYFKLK